MLNLHFVSSKYHGTNKESCLMDIKNKKVEIVVTTFETFRDHVVSKIKLQGLGAEFVFHLFLDD